MSVAVRRFEPGDASAVLALAPRLTEGMSPWRDPAACLAAVTGWVTDAVAAAGDEEHAVFVAADGDQVAGFVHVTRRTHFTGQAEAYVGELVTAAGQERRGIARSLMRAAEDWGASRGLALLTLETGAANATARAFYAALGYQLEDVRLARPIGPARGA